MNEFGGQFSFPLQLLKHKFFVPEDVFVPIDDNLQLDLKNEVKYN